MATRTADPRHRPWLTAKTGDPKGPAPWNPKGWRNDVAFDVLGVVEALREADALPVGPRTIGYRLSMRENASGMRYRKTNPTEANVEGWATFKDVVVVVKRLRQCGRLPWSYISDGSAVSHPVYGFASPEDWIEHRLDPDLFLRDLRYGQPVIVEIYVESAELTPLIARVASEYGVRVYSGRGSGGPDLAQKAAQRAWSRYVRKPDTGTPRTRTLILGIGDLDHAGVEGVMRPHVEHVGAFLTSLAGERSTANEILDFRRIAITVEQAIETNEALGIPLGSLAEYRDSGECDWTRDVRLLTDSPKTETEALDPASLRRLIREALEDVLDMGMLEAVKAEQEEQRRLIPGLLEKLRSETDGGMDGGSLS